MDMGTMYTNLRNYAEEQSSLLRQILDELKKQNAPAPSPELQAEAPLSKLPPDAVGPATIETVEIVDSGKTGTVTAKKGK